MNSSIFQNPCKLFQLFFLNIFEGGREENRRFRKIAEKSLTEIFPAEYYLHIAEWLITIFANFYIFECWKVESKNVRLYFFGSLTIRPRYFTAPKVNSSNLSEFYAEVYLFNRFSNKYRLNDGCSRSVLCKINIIIIQIIIIVFPCEW